MAGGTLVLLFFISFLAFSYGGPLTYEEFQDIRSQCPRYNGRYSVYIPHPRDCTEFFQCDNGRPMLVKCPQTLHFNPNSNVCDYKERAGCKGAETVTSITGSRGGLIRPGPNTPAMKWDRRCVGTRSDVTNFLPHETDCGHYYMCNSELAVHMFCPQGLQFNMNRKICDYPQNVRCPQKVRPRAPSGPAMEGQAITPESADVDQPPPIGKKDPRCPLRQGPMPIFLSSESNCGHYYVCDSGLAIPMSCPHHLLFNIDKNVCDHPENVKCPNRPGEDAKDDQVAGKEDIHEDTAANEDTSERMERVADDYQPSAFMFADENAPAGSALGPVFKKDPRCPRFNPAVPVFIPHETNCGQYYVCDWGYAITMDCPPTLAFNPSTNVCSLPRNC